MHPRLEETLVGVYRLATVAQTEFNSPEPTSSCREYPHGSAWQSIGQRENLKEQTVYS